MQIIFDTNLSATKTHYWAEEILSILHEQVNIGKAAILVTHNER